MAERNLQVLLANRPTGWVKESDFRIVESEIPAPGEGQVLVKALYLSLDPYMRGRMNDQRSYAAKVELGQVMTGEAVAEVVESRNARFRPGDTVAARIGWQHYALSDGSDMRKVDPSLVPVSLYLGTVGMPGVTAWIGLNDIGQPKAGETVVVSAASGAVGSVVGQLAKMRDCRVVGVAGGAEKCAFVVDELGFDAAVDHRAPDWRDQLAAATPKGIDVYFENVGGALLDAVLARCNPFARIPLCGMVSQYNAVERYGVQNLMVAVGMRIRLQGFIVSDNMARWPEALKELADGVRAGRIKYRESVTEGLENAPRAFIGLLKGENFGKQLVKVA
ncbi:MAG TPA: NADP-dependent oxidoreductase [Stellaceae bacterium]|jgi:NADPH-dependent curcumin reductase CurA|nr:NADP-dependent oxidoreductase [Stellaceae bacterium]